MMPTNEVMSDKEDMELLTEMKKQKHPPSEKPPKNQKENK